MQTDEYDLNVVSLIRHCPEYAYKNGVVRHGAFRLRTKQKESYLSFFCLEKLCADAGIPTCPTDGIRELEKYPPRNIRVGDAWIVLPSEKVRQIIRCVTGECPKIFFADQDGPPYHVGLEWEDKTLHNRVAKDIVKIIKQDHIFEITQDKDSILTDPH